MEQYSWLLPILKGLGPVVVGVFGAGGLYKIIEKIIEVTAQGRARRHEMEGASVAQLQTLNHDLQGKLLELTTITAELKWCNKDNERLQHENIELRNELKQVRTVSNAWSSMFNLLDDPEVKGVLERRNKEIKENTPDE